MTPRGKEDGRTTLRALRTATRRNGTSSSATARSPGCTALPLDLGARVRATVLSPDPQSVEDLSGRLGFAHSTAHSAARCLERLGILERVAETREREVHYDGFEGMIEDTLEELRTGRPRATEALRSLGEPPC